MGNDLATSAKMKNADQHMTSQPGGTHPDKRTMPDGLRTFSSIIECGIVDDNNGLREYSRHVGFFDGRVEVFTALNDPHSQMLVRPNLMVHRLRISPSRVSPFLRRYHHRCVLTPQVSMFVQRLRDSDPGVFQATGFTHKQISAKLGIKIGAYFVSVDVCRQIAEAFRKCDVVDELAVGSVAPNCTVSTHVVRQRTIQPVLSGKVGGARLSGKTSTPPPRAYSGSVQNSSIQSGPSVAGLPRPMVPLQFEAVSGYAPSCIVPPSVPSLPKASMYAAVGGTAVPASFMLAPTSNSAGYSGSPYVVLAPPVDWQPFIPNSGMVEQATFPVVHSSNCFVPQFSTDICRSSSLYQVAPSRVGTFVDPNLSPMFGSGIQEGLAMLQASMSHEVPRAFCVEGGAIGSIPTVIGQTILTYPSAPVSQVTASRGRMIFLPMGPQTAVAVEPVSVHSAENPPRSKLTVASLVESSSNYSSPARVTCSYEQSQSPMRGWVAAENGVAVRENGTDKVPQGLNSSAVFNSNAGSVARPQAVPLRSSAHLWPLPAHASTS